MIQTWKTPAIGRRPETWGHWCLGRGAVVAFTMKAAKCKLCSAERPAPRRPPTAPGVSHRTGMDGSVYVYADPPRRICECEDGDCLACQLDRQGGEL